MARPNPFTIPRSARRSTLALGCATALGVLLAGCGGSDSGPQRGTSNSSAAQTATLATTQIDSATAASGIQSLTGTAKCGVTVYKINYNTVGAKGENTTATTALMIPTGAAASCTGARPQLLYAHGTATNKSKDMAQVTTDGESSLVMAMFASQGFIVVAPNYTGYDQSTLPYHPYLNAIAQGTDLVDALRAVKAQLPLVGATASSKLFITGYSQGGHVAMATHRLIQQSYASEFTVTGSVGMSGPYSLTHTTQVVFAGQQNIGASIFTPLLVDSFQAAYGNIYSQPSDVYQSPFDTVAVGLFPATDAAAAAAKLPAGADGTYRTLFDQGNGQPFLIKTAFRTAAASPTSAWSTAVARNDLLNWKPAAPLAVCYGANDPTVFGFNSTDAQTFFATQGVNITRWDLEDATTVGATINGGFTAAKTQVSNAAGGGTAGANAVIGQYHGTLVPPFCSALARGLFLTL